MEPGQFFRCGSGKDTNRRLVGASVFRKQIQTVEINLSGVSLGRSQSQESITALTSDVIMSQS